ncbi:MAG: zinc ribbon domain-containing protein [Chitinophagaceae bacterium]|nr:zinc ribbon domain-containing protein [Chitinophagaceae bacterium]
MKKCTNCGAENHPQATDCITCGFPLTEQIQSFEKISPTAKPRLFIIMAIVIAVAGVALAFFLFNFGSKTNDQSAPATTSNKSAAESEKDNVDPEAKLKNIPDPGKYVIDEATLGRLTTKVTHFIHKNNIEDVEAMLDYFHYPVKRYHRTYKVSRVKLKRMLQEALENAEPYHLLKPDLKSATTTFDGRQYEVTLPATYEYGSNTLIKNVSSKRLRLKYIFNKQLEITAAYEM